MSVQRIAKFRTRLNRRWGLRLMVGLTEGGFKCKHDVLLPKYNTRRLELVFTFQISWVVLSASPKFLLGPKRDHHQHLFAQFIPLLSKFGACFTSFLVGSFHYLMMLLFFIFETRPHFHFYVHPLSLSPPQIITIHPQCAYRTHRHGHKGGQIQCVLYLAGWMSGSNIWAESVPHHQPTMAE